MSDQTPLSDEERAELEQLRAEKAAARERAQEQKERAELEQLRAEKARGAEEAARDKRIQEQRERGAKLMQPDDDLAMPLGQKIVLGVLAAIVVAIVLVMSFK